MPQESLTDEQIAEYTRVAFYYYKEGCTQQQIAERMRMSRQRVNRILSECLERGIVKITIEESTATDLLDLERRLRQKYDLLDVRVVNNNEPENIYVDLGAAGAAYLASNLCDGDIIGVSRGRTLSKLSEKMPIVNKKNLTIVQLMGNQNQGQTSTTVEKVAYTIAEKIKAKQYSLCAPFLVSSAEFKEAIKKENDFKEAYQIIKSCNIAVVGIGTAESALDKYIRSGLEMSKDDVLLHKGQINGEVAGSLMYDQEGKTINSFIHDRMISVELEDFMKIPMRIGVAGLPQKAEAIHGALLGKYINVLIVDTQTAFQLLDMNCFPSGRQ